MQNFTTKIVNMMKSEGLYASQGGPIILSQVRTSRIIFKQKLQLNLNLYIKHRFVHWITQPA